MKKPIKHKDNTNIIYVLNINKLVKSMLNIKCAENSLYLALKRKGSEALAPPPVLSYIVTCKTYQNYLACCETCSWRLDSLCRMLFLRHRI